MRYGDYDGVLDISVKRPVQRGYTVFANLLQSVNRGWGDYTVSLKHNVGRSEWGIDYHSNSMWQMDCYRDNVERILTADGTVMRTESGEAMPNRMVTHRASVNYSYSTGRDLLANVQGRLFRTDNRYVTAGNIVTEMDGAAVESYEAEVNPVKSWQGDVDLYLHKRFGNRHLICVNIVPSLVDSKSEHVYDTDGLHIGNRMDNRTVRLTGEALWEGRIARGMLAAGVRGNAQWAKSDDGAQTLRDDDARYGMFAQWKQTMARWQYYVGAETVWYRATSPVRRSYVSLAPKAFVRYATERCGAVSVYAEGVTRYPSLGDLTPTLQRVDRYQWFCGRPGLKPYQQYTARLKYDHQIRQTSIGLTLSNVRAVNPVMSVKTLTGEMILESPVNYGYNNHFEVKGNVRMPLFAGLLTVTAEGGWHSFRSRGEGYCHSYSQPFVNAQLMVMRGQWWAMVKYNSVYNILWGEKITSADNNLLNIGVGYTYRSATVMAGIVNPIGNVALSSRDLSALAGYDRTYHAASSRQLIWVGVTLNLRHGKSRPAVKKKLDNDTQYKSLRVCLLLTLKFLQVISEGVASCRQGSVASHMTESKGAKHPK